MPRENLEAEMDMHVDSILDVIEQGGREGIEIDPLASIMRRLQARGMEMAPHDMPPLLRMMIGGLE